MDRLRLAVPEYRMVSRAVIWTRAPILLALLLRVILMGIGFHGDLYAVYWRAHLLAYHGAAIEHNQLLVHLIHAGWLWVLRITHLVPHAIWIEPFDDSAGWRVLAQHSWAPVLLILLKLPYLAAELGALAALRSIVPFVRRATVTRYWLWNPLLLYGIHLYGRYESLPILLSVLSLAALVRRRPVAGFAALMGAVLTRFYAVLLVPLYWWLVPSSRLQRLAMTAWCILPLMLILAVQLAFSSSLPSFRDSAELASILTMPHRVFLFAAYVPLLQADVIYLFPLGLFLLYLAAVSAGRPAGADDLWKWSAFTLYLLFATTYFHAHWLAWLVPYLALQRGVRPYVGILTLLLAVAMVFYTFQFDREASVLLFAPMAPRSFESWPHPMELLDRVRLGGVVVGTFRTLLSAILLHLAWAARHDRPFADDST